MTSQNEHLPGATLEALTKALLPLRKDKFLKQSIVKQDWLEKSISLGRLHRRYFVLFQYGVLCYFRTDEDCQSALGSEELAPTPEKGAMNFANLVKGCILWEKIDPMHTVYYADASNVLRLTLLNKNDNIEVTCASRELAEQWMDAIEWSVRPHVASRFKYRFTKAMALLVNAVDNTDSLAPFRAALNKVRSQVQKGLDPSVLNDFGGFTPFSAVIAALARPDSLEALLPRLPKLMDAFRSEFSQHQTSANVFGAGDSRFPTSAALSYLMDAVVKARPGQRFSTGTDVMSVFHQFGVSLTLSDGTGALDVLMQKGQLSLKDFEVIVTAPKFQPFIAQSHSNIMTAMLRRPGPPSDKARLARLMLEADSKLDPFDARKEPLSAAYTLVQQCLPGKPFSTTLPTSPQTVVNTGTIGRTASKSVVKELFGYLFGRSESVDSLPSPSSSSTKSSGFGSVSPSGSTLSIPTPTHAGSLSGRGKGDSTIQRPPTPPMLVTKAAMATTPTSDSTPRASLPLSSSRSIHTPAPISIRVDKTPSPDSKFSPMAPGPDPSPPSTPRSEIGQTPRKRLVFDSDASCRPETELDLLGIELFQRKWAGKASDSEITNIYYLLTDDLSRWTDVLLSYALLSHANPDEYKAPTIKHFHDLVTQALAITYEEVSLILQILSGPQSRSASLPAIATVLTNPNKAERRKALTQMNIDLILTTPPMKQTSDAFIETFFHHFDTVFEKGLTRLKQWFDAVVFPRAQPGVAKSTEAQKRLLVEVIRRAPNDDYAYEAVSHAARTVSLDSDLLSTALVFRFWRTVKYLLTLSSISHDDAIASDMGGNLSIAESILQCALVEPTIIGDENFRPLLLQLFAQGTQDPERMRCFASGLKRFLTRERVIDLGTLVREVLNYSDSVEQRLTLGQALVHSCTDPAATEFEWVCEQLLLFSPDDRKHAEWHKSVSEGWNLPSFVEPEYFVKPFLYSAAFVSATLILKQRKFAEQPCKDILACIAESKDAKESKGLMQVQLDEKKDDDDGKGLGTISAVKQNHCGAFVAACVESLETKEQISGAAKLLNILVRRLRKTSPFTALDASLFELIEVLNSARRHPVFSTSEVHKMLDEFGKAPRSYTTTLFEDLIAVGDRILRDKPNGDTLLAGLIALLKDGSVAPVLQYVKKINKALINSMQVYDGVKHTALTLFAEYGHRHLATAEAVQVVKALMDAKADPNMPNGAGHLPLLTITQQNHLLSAIELIEGGANPAVQDSDGAAKVLRLFWTRALSSNGMLDDAKRLALAIFNPQRFIQFPTLLPQLSSSLLKELESNATSLVPFTQALLPTTKSPETDLRRFWCIQLFVDSYPGAPPLSQTALLEAIRVQFALLPAAPKADQLGEQRQQIAKRIGLKWGIENVDFNKLHTHASFWSATFMKLYRESIGPRYSPDYRHDICFVIFSCSDSNQALNDPKAESNNSLQMVLGNFQACIVKYASAMPELLKTLLGRLLKLKSELDLVSVADIFRGLSACVVRANSPIEAYVNDIFKLPAKQWPGKFLGLESVLLHATFAGIPLEQIHARFLEENEPVFHPAINKATELYRKVLQNAGQDVEEFTSNFEQACKKHLDRIRRLVGVTRSPTAGGHEEEYKGKIGPLSDEAIVEVLTFIRKVFIEHRKHGKQNPHHTQLLNLIIAAITMRDKKANVVSQTGTGQGKSITIALLSAFAGLMGYDVHNIMVTEDLAERDQKEFADFFKSLQLHSGEINRTETFGVRTGTMVQYVQADGYNLTSLFESKADHKQADSDRGKMLIVDEVDTLFTDDGGMTTMTMYGTLPDLTWFYRTVYEDRGMTDSSFEQNLKQSLQFRTLDPMVKTYVLKNLSMYRDKAQQAQHKTEGSDYTVEGGRIVIRSEATGEGTNMVWSGGLTQFLQLKHGIAITNENLAAYSTSHEQLFIEYNSVIGLTGSVGTRDEQEEMEQVYNMKIFKVPLFMKPRPMTRHPSQIHRSESAWAQAIGKACRACSDKRIPVLAVVDTVKRARMVGDAVRSACAGRTVQLLFGEAHESRETIIRQAGQIIADKGSVTVGSLVAARGLDFRVTDDAVDRAGGMMVIIGTFFSSERVETQAEGRTRRQDRAGQVQYILCEPHLSDFACGPVGGDVEEHLEKLRTARRNNIKKQIADRKKTRASHDLKHDICRSFFTRLRNRRPNLLPDQLQLLKTQWTVWYDMFWLRAKLTDVSSLRELFDLPATMVQKLNQGNRSEKDVAHLLLDHFISTTILK